MLPVRSLRLAIGTALAGSTPLDQETNENIIRLINAPFVPSETLVVGDLSFADFTGSAGLDQPVGAAQDGVDPTTDEQMVTITEPEGGWRWVTGDTANLPQTIYGFALLTATSAALLATELLEEPVTLTGAGQEINIGKARLRILSEPMS